MEVTGVCARVILDSRGLPTVEARVCTEYGSFVAAVPSGASTGTKEACELRDGDKGAFHGKGVQKAVDNVNNVIGPALVKEKAISVTDQIKIDEMLEQLDGTPNKTKLGANAILAVSQAVCRAGAAKKKVPLYKHINDVVNQVSPGTEACIPYMFFNVLNGGKHADNKLACQEIMFTVATAKSAFENLKKGSEIFHTLKGNIKKVGHTTNVGDEGGFAPNVDPQEGINLIKEAAENNGYGKDIRIGFDFAASEFETEPKSNKYDFDFKDSQKPKDKHTIRDSKEMVEYYVKLLKDNPEVYSIEDPMSEHAGPSFADLMAKIDVKKCQIVADDLTVTNPEIIKKCVENKEANALLVKINQIGSISSAIKACSIATKAGWNLMVSHRSGETTDAFVADFAVGLGAPQVKFGAPCRGERVAKYNRLLEIQEESKLKMSSCNMSL